MPLLRRLAILAALATLASLAALAPAASANIPAPPSQWYGLPGLDADSGASWVRSIAYSTPPNVVYAGLEGGGVFRSTNGGATWSSFNAGFPNPLTTNVRALLTSGTGTEVLAGTDNGVWKSSGGAWQPIGQGAGPDKLNGSVQSLFKLPSGVLLAGVASGGVWKSSDGGNSWTPPAPGNGMPSSETPYDFVGQPPQAPQFVLAAAADGVFRSTDGGTTWSPASDGIPANALVLHVWVDTSKPIIYYASTGSDGIYRSVNGGVTWAPINNGLNAVRARGFQIFTANEGAHLYAATENGLWEAFNTHDDTFAEPKWRPVTKQGLNDNGGNNIIMWALTAPVIPGSGAAGLIAGTQSNGGYFLSFAPPDSPCPQPHTSNVTTNCPRLNDTTPTRDQQLTVIGNGVWTGTAQIDFTYQWQKCTALDVNTCSDITGADQATYVVPHDSNLRYRVRVYASNPAPTFNQVFRTTAITGVAGANPVNAPGATQVYPPGTPTISAQGQSQFHPGVGDTLRIPDGTSPSLPTRDAWFNPPATSYAYQWLRCGVGGTDCNEIPGATARTYVLKTEDGDHVVKGRVIGTNASGSRQLESNNSAYITSLPAAIADPILDPPNPPKSQAPMITGNAWVGETLAGNVGGWKDPTTEFQRRWLQCDTNGGSCTIINKVASVQPENGPTYVVRQGDLGYTIRMRVTADVNNDFTNGGGSQNPPAVEVDTPQSAIVTTKPVPPAGGGGGDGGGGGGGTGGGDGPGGGGGIFPDITPPEVSGLTVTNKKFRVAAAATAVSARAPKGTKFKFGLSEPATAVIAIDQLKPGRKVSGKCRAPTRKNRKTKRCTRVIRRGTLTRAGLGAGANTVAFSGRIGTRKLGVGSYRASVAASDLAGNASLKAARVKFKIVRR